MTTFADVRSGPTSSVNAVDVVIVGVPSSAGSAWEGAGNGPFFLRKLSKYLSWGPSDPAIISIRAHRAVATHRIVDLGNLDIDGLDATAVAGELQRTLSSLPRGAVPGIMGGDHSLTAGAIASLVSQYEDLIVIQFDHHLDVQMWGAGEQDPLFNTNVMSHVATLIGDERCFQIGVGDFAAVERSNIEVALKELRRVGTQLPLGQSLDKERLRTVIGAGRPVYITFDVDVLSSAEMSSTSYPAVAGISVSTVLGLIDTVLEDNQLVGFDVVEFAAPAESRDEKTLGDAARASLIFAHLISHALGHDPYEE